MLTLAALAAIDEALREAVDQRYSMPSVDTARAFLAAQDRDALLQDAANAAWPTARRLCQEEHTDMCFGDVVALTRAVIDALLGGEA